MPWMSQKQLIEREELRNRIRRMLDRGAKVPQIAEALGISARSVAGHIRGMAQAPYVPVIVAKPAEKAPEVRVRVAAHGISTGLLSVSERVAPEAERRSLIRAMGENPTDEQRVRLQNIVRRIEADDCARAALRSAA